MFELFKHLNLNDQSIPNDSEEEKLRKIGCECGYNPHDSESFLDDEDYELCSNKLALKNHITFPSFEFISDYDDPSLIYYNLEDSFFPARHWATLLEIKEVISFIRRGLIGWNQFGEQVRVMFYPENQDEPKTFAWSDLKVGNTIVVLYPEKKTFMDLTTGIRQENLANCFIFKAPLKFLQEEAQHLLNSADSNSNGTDSECFGCCIKSKNLSTCSVCKLAKYCSKECQTLSWKKVHKKICKQSETLLRLSALPRHRFSEYLEFNNSNDSESSLLPYKPIKKNKKKRF